MALCLLLSIRNLTLFFTDTSYTHLTHLLIFNTGGCGYDHPLLTNNPLQRDGKKKDTTNKTNKHILTLYSLTLYQIL